MRVLQVIPSVSMLRGGASAAVLDLCRGLAEEGVDVTLATTNDDGTGRSDVQLESPIKLNGYTTWYFNRQTRFYCFSWPLTRWLIDNVRYYDCVHIHSVFSYPPIPASVLAAHKNVPYIVTPHGILMAWGREHRRPVLKRISIKLIEKNILRGAAILHLTSEQERAEIPDVARSLPSIIIPLGIDLEPFAHKPPSGWLRSQYQGLRGRLIVLFLARLDQKKGLDILLSAFQQVVRQDVSAALVIAGDGEPAFVEYLRKEVARLGIGGDVFFTGFLDEKEKVLALADADIFALSSRSENFGVVAVEAMACSLPLVITDQVGIHPLVSEAEAGIVVPCEKEALAKALRELALDETIRRSMGRAASALAEEKFSLVAMARAMAGLYERTVAAG